MKAKIKCGKQIFEKFVDLWDNDQDRFYGYTNDRLKIDDIRYINSIAEKINWNIGLPGADNIFDNIRFTSEQGQEDAVYLTTKESIDMYSAVLYYCSFLSHIRLHPLIYCYKDGIVAGVWLRKEWSLNNFRNFFSCDEDLLYENGGELALINAWNVVNKNDEAIILGSKDHPEIFSSDKHYIIDFEENNDGDFYISLYDIEEQHIPEKQTIDVQYVKPEIDIENIHFLDMSAYEKAVSDMFSSYPLLMVENIPADIQYKIVTDAVLNLIKYDKKVLVVADEKGKRNIHEYCESVGLENKINGISVSVDDEISEKSNESAELSIPQFIKNNFHEAAEYQKKLNETDEFTGKTIREIYMDCNKIFQKKLADDYLYDNDGNFSDPDCMWDDELIDNYNYVYEFNQKYGKTSCINIDMIHSMDIYKYNSFKRLVCDVIQKQQKFNECYDSLAEKLDVNIDPKRKYDSESSFGIALSMIDICRELINLNNRKKSGIYEYYKRYDGYIRKRNSCFNPESFEEIFAADKSVLLEWKQRLITFDKREQMILKNAIGKTCCVSTEKSSDEWFTIIKELLDERLIISDYFEDFKMINQIFGEYVDDMTFDIQYDFVCNYDVNSDIMLRLLYDSAAKKITLEDELFKLTDQFKYALNNCISAYDKLQSFFINHKGIDKSLLKNWYDFIKEKYYEKYQSAYAFVKNKIFFTEKLLTENDSMNKLSVIIAMHNVMVLKNRSGLDFEFLEIQNNRFNNLYKQIVGFNIEYLKNKNTTFTLALPKECADFNENAVNGFDIIFICNSETVNYNDVCNTLCRCLDQIYLCSDKYCTYDDSVLINVGDIGTVLMYESGQ